jgi:TfoX/Sxy family transcriptional regulator of competence genes
MGDGRASDKIMLPESMMDDPDELYRWIARAFEAASRLPKKAAKKKRAKKPSKKPAKKPAKKPRSGGR